MSAVNKDEDPSDNGEDAKNDRQHLATETEESHQSPKDQKDCQQNKTDIPCEPHLNFLSF